MAAADSPIRYAPPSRRFLPISVLLPTDTPTDADIAREYLLAAAGGLDALAAFLARESLGMDPPTFTRDDIIRVLDGLNRRVRMARRILDPGDQP